MWGPAPPSSPRPPPRRCGCAAGGADICGFACPTVPLSWSQYPDLLWGATPPLMETVAVGLLRSPTRPRSRGGPWPSQPVRGWHLEWRGCPWRREQQAGSWGTGPLSQPSPLAPPWPGWSSPCPPGILLLEVSHSLTPGEKRGSHKQEVWHLEGVYVTARWSKNGTLESFVDFFFKSFSPSTTGLCPCSQFPRLQSTSAMSFGRCHVRTPLPLPSTLFRVRWCLFVCSL